MERSLIPPHDSTIRFSKKFRFVNGSASTSDVIDGRGITNMLCMATGATTAYELIYGARIRRVKVWCLNSSGGGTSCSVQWNGSIGSDGFGTPGIVISDSQLGTSTPAMVDTRPPKGSLADTWFVSGNTNKIFVIRSTSTYYVDIWLDLILYNNLSGSSPAQTPTIVTGSVTGATVGTTYVRALDSSGGNNLAPVDYLTI
jgi:hypothetical protein